MERYCAPNQYRIHWWSNSNLENGNVLYNNKIKSMPQTQVVLIIGKVNASAKNNQG